MDVPLLALEFIAPAPANGKVQVPGRRRHVMNRTVSFHRLFIQAQDIVQITQADWFKIIDAADGRSPLEWMFGDVRSLLGPGLS